MACPIPVGPGTGALGAVEPFEFVPQSDGVLTLRVTVSPAEGNVDVNPDNDTQSVLLLIGPAPVADLAVTNLELTTEQPAVNEPFDFLADVTNLGPEPTYGGTLRFLALGEGLELGTVASGCVGNAFDNDGDGVNDGVVVTCGLAALGVGDTDGNGRLRIIPRTAGTISVRATVSPAVATDPNRNNDRAFLQLEL